MLRAGLFFGRALGATFILAALVATILTAPLPVLDPVHNTASRVDLSIANPDTPPAAAQSQLAPSPYWG